MRLIQRLGPYPNKNLILISLSWQHCIGGGTREFALSLFLRLSSLYSLNPQFISLVRPPYSIVLSLLPFSLTLYKPNFLSLLSLVTDDG